MLTFFVARFIKNVRIDSVVTRFASLGQRMSGKGDVMTQLAMRSEKVHAPVCLPDAFLEWRMIHEAASVAARMIAMLMPCEGSST